jgi:hypothetical protein
MRWPFILNLLFVLFITGFAWTLFQIVFVMFFSIMILGAMYANAFDKL